MLKKYIRLRWRFDYLNETRCGVWDAIGETMDKKAHFQPRPLKAFIEATDKTGDVYPFVEVDGHDFVRFEWLGCVRVPNIFSIRKVRLPPKIIGAAIVTTSQRVTVTIDGKHKIEPLSPADFSIIGV
jgi:hypothetical protein